jgi:alkylhydroperoxidase family enzyme
MESEQGRIRLLEREEIPPGVRELYDLLIERRGVVPYMFKTLAHTPALALGVAAFLKPLMGDGALPGWYKELVAVRVALLNNCHY